MSDNASLIVGISFTAMMMLFLAFVLIRWEILERRIRRAMREVATGKWDERADDLLRQGLSSDAVVLTIVSEAMDAPKS